MNPDPALAVRHIPIGDDFLAADALAQLTPELLAQRMRELAPQIAASAREAEGLRQPVNAAWDALRRAGYFYQYVPREYGGLEVTVDQFIDATLPIAEGCTSSGWTASFCAEHNYFLTHFPEATQAELFGGKFPYIIAPGVTNPPGQAVPVDGGYRVTAHWKFGTGITHADWVIGGIVVQGQTPPVMLMCLVRAEDVIVPDTWHVAGMAATGSHDIIVRDVFVPAAHTTRMDLMRDGRGSGSRGYGRAHYDMPLLPFLALVASVPALGAARAAVRAFREGLEAGARGNKAERPSLHMRLGQAVAMVETAELLIRSAGREMPGVGSLEPDRQIPERIRLRAQIAHALGQCRDAVYILSEAAGSRAQALDNPIQRAARDIAMIATHIVFDCDQAYELLGRSTLGLPPNALLV